MLIGQKWGCQGTRFCGELFRPHCCNDEGAQGKSMRASFRPVESLQWEGHLTNGKDVDKSLSDLYRLEALSPRPRRLNPW